MTRNLIAAVLCLTVVSTALGQQPGGQTQSFVQQTPAPISGAFPPWSPPSPKGPPSVFPIPPSPALIPFPAGKPLVGYYKMEARHVGDDNRYPFDTGEFNLAGFEGNARIFGQFTVTLPNPQDVDPINQSIPYKHWVSPFSRQKSCGSSGPKDCVKP